MKFFQIPLSDTDKDVYVDAYIADPTKAFTRKAILVIPGGGYGGVCADREGEPIAMAFLPYGYNAFVLHYTVGRKRRFPAQLIEASLAMAHIRSHAEEYGIDPDQVFTVGFSAGGHLAASLATMWKLPAVYEATGIPYGVNKPTGAMLIYPVISGTLAKTHSGTFRNLLCTDTPSPEELAMCSIENHVDADSAPAYIMHTVTDQAVYVGNALTVAKAYAEAGLQFEMHIYPDAPHGVALGNPITAGHNEKWNNPAIAEWVRTAAAWADSLCK